MSVIGVGKVQTITPKRSFDAWRWVKYRSSILQVDATVKNKPGQVLGSLLQLTSRPRFISTLGRQTLPSRFRKAVGAL